MSSDRQATFAAVFTVKWLCYSVRWLSGTTPSGLPRITIVWMRFLVLLALSLSTLISASIFQARPVSAQGPSADNRSSETPSQVSDSLDSDSQDARKPAPLEFHKARFNIAREGYVSLSWDSLDTAGLDGAAGQDGGAIQYEVIDAAQRSHYRGAFPNAFISGLSDGQHSFQVIAYNEAQQVVARSNVPAELTVEHWSLRRALTLFFIGLAVFIAIIAVIVIGSWTSPIETTSTAPQVAEKT